MAFETPPIRRGGSGSRPTHPVSAGIRQRGRTKKLTPFVSFRADIADALFGRDFLEAGGYLKILVGKGNDSGKIRLLKSTEALSVIRLRRPTQQSDEWIVESVLIPGAETMNPIKRTPIVYSSIDDGAEMTLPWVKKPKAGEL